MKRLFRIIRFYFEKALHKDPLVKNMHHPDYTGMIEYAFTAGGRDYYTFKEVSDAYIPYGRYMFVMNFLQELRLRVSFDLLKEYIKKFKAQLTVKNGKVDLGMLSMLIAQLESRMKLMFDAETTYRLASVLYFDSDEIITKYDKKYCDIKIERWREAGTLDFFYARPMKELIGLKSISQTDLQTYLEAVETMDEETRSFLQKL